MEFKTNRLLLRQARIEDREALLTYCLDPRVRQYEAESLNEAQVIQYLDWTVQTQYHQPRDFYYFTVVYQKDGVDTVVGSVHISIRSRENSQAELGFLFGVSYWNKGYASEAVQRLLTFCFKELRIHRLYSEVISDDLASIFVLEQLSFRREAVMRHNRFFRNRWWDSYLYALLGHEWRE
ncbi:GNAT family protein [Anaerolineales bacterium]